MTLIPYTILYDFISFNVIFSNDCDKIETYTNDQMGINANKCFCSFVKRKEISVWLNWIIIREMNAYGPNKSRTWFIIEQKEEEGGEEEEGKEEEEEEVNSGNASMDLLQCTGSGLVREWERDICVREMRLT